MCTYFLTISRWILFLNAHKNTIYMLILIRTLRWAATFQNVPQRKAHSVFALLKCAHKIVFFPHSLSVHSPLPLLLTSNISKWYTHSLSICFLHSMRTTAAMWCGPISFVVYLQIEKCIGFLTKNLVLNSFLSVD